MDAIAQAPVTVAKPDDLSTTVSSERTPKGRVCTSVLACLDVLIRYYQLQLHTCQVVMQRSPLRAKSNFR